MDVMKTIQEILAFSVGDLSVGNIISAIVIFIICYMVIQCLMSPVDKMLNRFGFDKTLHGFMRATIRVLLNFIMVCIIAQSIGIPIASLIAVLSMLGLAVALSVQGAFSNLANGIMLLIAKPFKAGEYVAIGGSGAEGFVVEITLVCVKILTIDNKVIFVPNSEVAANKITNFSSEPLRRVDLTFCAGYDVPVETAKLALKEAVDSLPQALQDPAPFINIMSYKEYSLEYVVRVWVKSEVYWDGYFGLLEAVKKSYEKHGINAAIPHLNVHMKDK